MTTIKGKGKAASLAKWMMRRGRLLSYRVAIQIAESEDPSTAAPI